jgi:hypothetical protein
MVIAFGWHETVFDPARTSYLEARGEVPHYTTVTSYMSNGGVQLHMSTSIGTHVAIATSILRDGGKNMVDTFNPAEWLASFRTIGGAYVFNGERLHLWITPNGQSEDEVRTPAWWPADRARRSLRDR